MFRNEDMARQLFALARKGLFVNHQERELVKSAATRLMEDAELRREVRMLRTEVRALRRRLARRVGEPEGDGGEGRHACAAAYASTSAIRFALSASLRNEPSKLFRASRVSCARVSPVACASSR